MEVDNRGCGKNLLFNALFKTPISQVQRELPHEDKAKQKLCVYLLVFGSLIM